MRQSFLRYITLAGKIVGALTVIATTLYGIYSFVYQKGAESMVNQIRQEQSMATDSLVLQQLGQLKADVTTIKDNVVRIGEVQGEQNRLLNALDKAMVNHLRQNNSQWNELLQYYEYLRDEKKNVSP